jgi:hypothetical protein
MEPGHPTGDNGPMIRALAEPIMSSGLHLVPLGVASPSDPEDFECVRCGNTNGSDFTFLEENKDAGLGFDMARLERGATDMVCGCTGRRCSNLNSHLRYW